MKAWHAYTARELLELNDQELCLDWVRNVLHGEKGGFMQKLLEAAMVADTTNMGRLMEGFEYEIGLVIWYKSGINPMRIGEVKEARGR